MRVITDFHIHSKYARACSKDLTLSNIVKWCEIKGLDVVGTGDFTHPAWFASIKEELEEAGDGLFALAGNRSKTRLMLTTELSSIYKQGDKVRRIHLCVLLSSIPALEKFIAALEARGVNLKSDGRPILGLSAPEIVKMVLEADPRGLVVPAHAWTPWFAVFGSKSGFDSLEECFGEMTPHIYAIETGLSSDPAMNWRLSKLDDILLLSNSDAHSLRNLGREANVFAVDNFDYQTLYDILKHRDRGRFVSTIEFFPEEGMYHFDGHRVCKFCCQPAETKRLDGICPVCKKTLTVGVLNRVEALADRPAGSAPAERVPYQNIVPLEIIIGEAMSRQPGTKTVLGWYQKMTSVLGSEFAILLDRTYEEISSVAPKEIVEGIRRVRDGKLHISPGYDGVYGTVTLFEAHERIKAAQASLLV
ncbi:DNA helicase UvrD [Candidatus Uhrbacteria bacterium]|nr:DNA helicase UvrD [Candidatus Uhrbacteria bacterium]